MNVQIRFSAERKFFRNLSGPISVVPRNMTSYPSLQKWRFIPSTLKNATTYRLSRRFEPGKDPYYARDSVRVDTMYKRKAQKVLPMDVALPDGSMPEGQANWKRTLEPPVGPDDWKKLTGIYEPFLTPRFSGLARGARLTPERLDRLIVGDHLTSRERELLVEMLYNREAALT